jgi:hypothetical protein
MAGTQNLRYATEYQLDNITLLTSVGSGIIDLTPLLVEFSLFEDIHSATISGNLVVSDSLGLLSNFRVNGTEFIQISLRKFLQDNNPINRTFRVFKISNRTVNASNAYEVYTLNFCSEEFLFSEQYRISKGYKNTKISDIITDILTNYVKVGISKTKNIYIESTQGVYDFVLPNKKIFETINWLSTYAQPVNNVGADMLFYENNYGYFFNSLQTLYEQPEYQTYFYNPKNISTEISDQIINVTDFEVLDFFDTLSGINNGIFANKTITFDVLTRTKLTNNMFSYDDYVSKSKHLNSYPITNNYQNRRGDTMYQVMDGVDLEMGALRMATGNQKEKMNSYVMNSKGGANNVANDIFIETYLKNRVAQIGLINYTRIKIVVPGDPSVTIGKTVNFKTFATNPAVYSPGGVQRVYDPFYSGKYLVTACRHIVTAPRGTYITVLELSKESVSDSYSSYNNSDPLIKSTVNGVQ